MGQIAGRDRALGMRGNSPMTVMFKEMKNSGDDLPCFRCAVKKLEVSFCGTFPKVMMWGKRGLVPILCGAVRVEKGWGTGCSFVGSCFLGSSVTETI